MANPHYTQTFYERLRGGATRSAEIIVPLALQLFPVRSVVDVGCGDGSWLAVFQKLGVPDIFGLDGDYVQKGSLQIPADRFRPVDLSKPFDLGRVFDLALSLEVAEHLPPESGPIFVKSLTNAAPAVLFSAAIPHQGGQNHVNEQWPDMWAELFKLHDYVPVDFIRRRIWQNMSVEFWYAQNTLLFVRRDQLDKNEALREEFERTNQNQLSLVHPRQYLHLEAVMRARPSGQPTGVRQATRLFLVCLGNAIRKRFAFAGGERRTEDAAGSSKPTT